jgi:hypothetical protein
MKFDVVLGNPPFQNGNTEVGNYALWPLFVKKGDEVLADAGVMAMVVPQTWASNRKTAGPHAKTTTTVRRDVLATGYLQVANFNIAHYFEQVASTFSYFLWHKTKQDSSTTVITPNGEYQANYDSVKWLKIRLDTLPPPITPDLKLIDGGKEDTRFRSSAKGMGTGPYKIANTSAQYTKGEFTLSPRPHPYQSTKKVIFSDSGYSSPFYDPGEIGLGHHARGFEVESEEEAKAVIEFLNSDYLIDLASTIPDSGSMSHLGKLLYVGFFDK